VQQYHETAISRAYFKIEASNFELSEFGSASCCITYPRTDANNSK
jgi:hypothetical protein